MLRLCDVCAQPAWDCSGSFSSESGNQLDRLRGGNARLSTDLSARRFRVCVARSMLSPFSEAAGGGGGSRSRKVCTSVEGVSDLRTHPEKLCFPAAPPPTNDGDSGGGQR